MDGVSINFDETINLGIQVFNKGDEFHDVVSQVQRVIDELQIAWQGADASKFLEELNEECREMEKLSSYINEIGLLIQKTANSYQDVYLSNIKF